MAAAPLNVPYRPSVQFRGELSPLSSIYKPLNPNYFRVLELLGLDEYGILRCFLHPAPFKDDSEFPYVAISYTWNPNERIWYSECDTYPKPVRIDGTAVMLGDKVANILCLCHQYDLHFIWIDGICINQEDMEEKSCQVAQMGEIYSHAIEVRAFIGSPAKMTDDMMDMINTFNDHPNLKLPPKFLTGFVSFFDNDYWRRAWIFQELALARTLIFSCGSRSACFDTLTSTTSKHVNLFDTGDLWAKISMGFVGVRVVKSVLSRARKYGSIDLTDPVVIGERKTSVAFLEVLRESRQHNGCSNPSDLLYSRMALASDALMLIPYPDYTIKERELFKRFATNSIIRTGSLEIVTFATSTTMYLPTWVPDWTSLHGDWDHGLEYQTLRVSLNSLRWNNTDPPRISNCRSELMVLGKVLRIIQTRDYEAMYMSALMAIGRSRAHNSLSDLPRKGDLICVLRGCPLLVHLRKLGDHFIVVGRRNHFQETLFKPPTGLITGTPSNEDPRKMMWSLNAIDEVQKKTEEIFRIR